MISVLIVDDSDSKIQEIRQLLESTHGSKDIDICTASNIQQATRMVKKKLFSLAILDLNIPLVQGREAQRDGGLRLLKNLETQRRLKMPIKLVGLTAYDDAMQAHRMTFESKSYVLIKYENRSTDWHEPISSAVVQLLNSEASGAEGALPSSALEIWLIAACFIIVTTSVFLPIAYSPTQRLSLFILCAMLVSFLFGKNAQAKLKLKLPGVIFTTLGSGATALATLLVLTHLSTSDVSVGVFEVMNEVGQYVDLDTCHISAPFDEGTRKATTFVDGQSLIVVFPAGTEKIRLSVCRYTGILRYSRERVQVLRFGKELKKVGP